MNIDFPRLIRGQAGAFNFIVYRQVAQALTLHASAQLALGNTPVALQDATALYRLANTLRGYPSLVGAMMKVALTGLYLQVVWEGLAGQRWDAAELVLIERQLASLDLLSDCFLGLEGGQAAINWWLEQTPPPALSDQLAVRITGGQMLGQSNPLWTEPIAWFIRWGPRGWIRQTQIGFTEKFQTQLEQLDLPGQHERVTPSPHTNFSTRQNILREIGRPISALVRRYGLNYVKAVQVTTRYQTGIHQARLACALERYRLVHGVFPDDLLALTPSFLDRIPQDLMNGSALKFDLLENGSYVLYSVGWDEKDDAAGGADWVWRYPAKP